MINEAQGRAFTDAMTPTTIATADTGTDAQRQLIDSGTRYFFFYSDGTNLTYISTSDGTTWASETDIRACDTSQDFSIWFNRTSSNIYYVHTDSTDTNTSIVYCKGTISGLNINFDMEYLIHNSSIATDQHTKVNVCVTPQGKALVTASYYNDTAWSWYVIGGNCSDDNGHHSNWTWTNLVSDKDYSFDTAIIPLSTGEAYALYWSNSETGYKSAHGRLWNTTAWESEENITTKDVTKTSISAVNYQDQVHLVYMYADGTDRGIIHRKRNSTAWENETTIKNASFSVAESLSGLSLSINQSGSELFVVWTTKTSNIIAYQFYDGSSWQANYTVWHGLTQIGYEPVLPYEFVDDTVPVIWREGTGGLAITYFMYGVPAFSPASYETTNTNFESEHSPYIYDNTHTIIALSYHPHTLTFTVEAESPITSTTEIHCQDLGEPRVEGCDSKSFDDDTKLLAITVNHASSRDLILSWDIKGAGLFVLSVYVKQDSTMLQDVIVSVKPLIGSKESEVNKTTTYEGLAQFELAYGSYLVQAYYQKKVNTMRVLVTSNRDIGFDFSTPPRGEPKLVGLVLLPVVAVIAFLLFKRVRR